MTQTGVLMTYDVRCRISGWVASSVLHLCAVGLAVILVEEMKPPADPSPFQWEVALIEAVNRSDSPQAAASPADPAPSPPKVDQSVPPTPTVVTRQVHTRVETRVAQDRPDRIDRQVQPVKQREEAVQEPTTQAVQPVIETAMADEQQPIQERAAILSANAAKTAVESVPVESPTTIDRIESTPAVVSTATTDVARTVAANHAEESVSAPVVERGAPVESAAPIVESRQPLVAQAVTSGAESVVPKEERTAVVTAQEIYETPVPATVTQQVAALPPAAEAGSVKTAPESPPSDAAPEAVRSPISEQKEAVGRETDQVVAKSSRQTPGTKADYRWLAESLYHRIAELKRYPSAARLNGWEGKVVLRAVIKADGNLADLRVQKSSGFDALDQAALDTVRQACPLHLKHELGRPEVVVSLPIVYSLSN